MMFPTKFLNEFITKHRDTIYLITIIIAPLILISFIIIFVYFWNSYSYWKRRNVPYVKPIFPFGSFNPINFLSKGLHFAMEENYKIFKKQGSRYFGIYAITTPMLTIIDPDLIKLIWIKDNDYFLSHGFKYDKRDVLTTTLFYVEGKDWKNAKRKISPVFSSTKLKSMFGTLNDCTIPLMEYLGEFKSNRFEINITELNRRFFTYVIGSWVFGFECNSIKDPDDVFRKYSREGFDDRFDLYIRKAIEFIAPFLIKYLGLKILRKEVEVFFKTIFKRIFDSRENSNVRRNDFVQILVDLKQKSLKEGEIPLSHDEMLAISILFFTGGFGPSSNITSYCLHELAYHQNIQRKVREEIKFVIERNNGINYDCLVELKYTNQVILETIRKHPVVATMSRTCTEDYEIPDGPEIKKGMKIFINVLGLHWDEEYFPNPKIFDPERFSDENTNTMLPCVFLPFAVGPRKCIAEKFGLAQIRIALVAVLTKYIIKPHPKTGYQLDYKKNNVLLSATNPIYVTMERIQ